MGFYGCGQFMTGAKETGANDMTWHEDGLNKNLLHWLYVSFPNHIAEILKMP